MKDDSIFYSIIWTLRFLMYVESQFPTCFEDNELQQLNDNFLVKTNFYRKQHGVHELLLDLQLMRDAKGWSKHMAMEEELEHSVVNIEYGENIWAAYNTTIFDNATMDPIKDWYNEVKDYKFDEVHYKSDAANFTQLVWKSTIIMGCGMCMSSDAVFLTCRFSPPGNVEFEYIENVFPFEDLKKKEEILFLVLFVGAIALLFLMICVYKYCKRNRNL